ncbi:MAG TPA: N,N-dimethylformamidase beta subunit family domain-containing protein [Chryseosolibacter sp.]
MIRNVYTGIFFIIHFCLGCSSKSELPRTLCAAHLTEGYTDKVSYLPGEKVKLYLHASHPVDPCALTIFSVNGDSVFSVWSRLPFHAKYPWNTGSTDGFRYPLTSEFTLPEVKSGIYLIGNKIPIIVKTRKAVDLLVIYPSNTANAYSFSGGKNLYSLKMTQVSFERPIELQPYSKHCLNWLVDQSDFSVGYVSDIDLEDFNNISSARIVSIIGHSEYWTRLARENFDRFVNEGKHAIVLSGNTMWWQVRYSEDGTKLICFRDADRDSIHDPLLKTIAWNHPSLNYPVVKSIGSDFAHGGYGKEKDSGWDGYKIIAESSPLLEGTNVKRGDVISLPTLEYDGTLLKGTDKHGYPVMDVHALGFIRGEIIAFDRGFREGETTPTFIVFQKTATSGIVVNAGSTEWCGAGGIGGQSGEVIKKITRNAIVKLLHNENVFVASSPDDTLATR